MSKKISMKLQIFAEPPQPPEQNPANPPQAPEGQQAPAFDYDKLANLIAGKQSVTEESVLKGYFKQQGLSKEQMEQAITAFKQQQADKQPDVAGMQNQITETQKQLTQAQAAVQKAQIESAATMTAISLGIQAKTIPYVLKMADFSQVIGQDGKVSEEALTAAINKVLEDIPALKPQADAKSGFMQIGTGGNPQQQPQQTTANQAAVPTKRWNRFN